MATPVDPDELLGLTEVAHVLGKTRQYVWNKTERQRKRPADLPPLFVMPVGRVRATELWAVKDVVAWVNDHRSGDELAQIYGRIEQLRTERRQARAGSYPGGTPAR